LEWLKSKIKTKQGKNNKTKQVKTLNGQLLAEYQKLSFIADWSEQFHSHFEKTVYFLKSYT
jgi:hypothetical protein